MAKGKFLNCIRPAMNALALFGLSKIWISKRNGQCTLINSKAIIALSVLLSATYTVLLIIYFLRSYNVNAEQYVVRILTHAMIASRIVMTYTFVGGVLRSSKIKDTIEKLCSYDEFLTNMGYKYGYKHVWWFQVGSLISGNLAAVGILAVAFFLEEFESFEQMKRIMILSTANLSGVILYIVEIYICTFMFAFYHFFRGINTVLIKTMQNYLQMEENYSKVSAAKCDRKIQPQSIGYLVLSDFPDYNSALISKLRQHTSIEVQNSLQCLMDSYDSLTCTARDFNDIVAVKSSLILLLEFFLVLMTSFNVYYYLAVNHNVLAAGSDILRLLLSLLRLFCVLKLYSEVQKEAYKTGIYIHRYLMDTECGNVRNKMVKFSRQVLFNSLKFTAHGLYHIKLELLSQIVGTAATYLFILMQFQEENFSNKT